MRKFSFFKEFRPYPHRLWINVCIVPRQKCANLLLQASTWVGQKSVITNIPNEFMDLTTNSCCAGAGFEPERPFSTQRVPLCTTESPRSPHHALFAILYRLCQVPVLRLHPCHEPMPKDLALAPTTPNTNQSRPPRWRPFCVESSDGQRYWPNCRPVTPPRVTRQWLRRSAIGVRWRRTRRWAHGPSRSGRFCCRSRRCATAPGPPCPWHSLPATGSASRRRAQ